MYHFWQACDIFPYFLKMKRVFWVNWSRLQLSRVKSSLIWSADCKLLKRMNSSSLIDLALRIFFLASLQLLLGLWLPQMTLAQGSATILPTVNYEIDQAGPNGESLRVSAVVVPEEIEPVFLSELIGEQRRLSISTGPERERQLLIIQPATARKYVPDSAETALPNISVMNLNLPIVKIIQSKNSKRMPAVEVSGPKKAGIYVAMTSVMGYALAFYVTFEFGPATAGNVVAGALLYLMSVKPQLLWGYLNGGGRLAARLLGHDVNRNLKAVVHESGKAVAGVLFNILLTSAFTVGLNYPTLFEQFPSFLHFSDYILPTAVASFASKNMWDMVISKWKTNASNSVSDKTALLLNYSKILFIGAVAPLMYIESTRTGAMITLGFFGALAVPGLYFEEAYRSKIESIIRNLENSRLAKVILSFSQKSQVLSPDLKHRFWGLIHRGSKNRCLQLLE